MDLPLKWSSWIFVSTANITLFVSKLPSRGYNPIVSVATARKYVNVFAILRVPRGNPNTECYPLLPKVCIRTWRSKCLPILSSLENLPRPLNFIKTIYQSATKCLHGALGVYHFQRNWKFFSFFVQGYASLRLNFISGNQFQFSRCWCIVVV